jgi:NAD(P)-dependent dehydrogenase (short-subunit alcohol dehydrogenase family)
MANVSGVVGNLASMPGSSVYTACVAALEAHTLNLAAEMAGTGLEQLLGTETGNIWEAGQRDSAH